MYHITTKGAYIAIKKNLPYTENKNTYSVKTVGNLEVLSI